MGEPARKLDHNLPPPPAQPPRPSRRARVLPLRQREDEQRGSDTWVLDRIVLWYRTRRD
jgi:hypothetical protein